MRIKLLSSMLAATLCWVGTALADDPLYGADRGHLDASVFRGHSCDELWFMRNRLDAGRGYCVRTERAIRTFGNAICVSSSEHLLNGFERANARTIRDVESARG